MGKRLVMGPEYGRSGASRQSPKRKPKRGNYSPPRGGEVVVRKIEDEAPDEPPPLPRVRTYRGRTYLR